MIRCCHTTDVIGLLTTFVAMIVVPIVVVIAVANVAVVASSSGEHWRVGCGHLRRRLIDVDVHVKRHVRGTTMHVVSGDPGPRRTRTLHEWRRRSRCIRRESPFDYLCWYYLLILATTTTTTKTTSSMDAVTIWRAITRAHERTSRVVITH